MDFVIGAIWYIVTFIAGFIVGCLFVTVFTICGKESRYEEGFEAGRKFVPKKPVGQFDEEWLKAFKEAMEDPQRTFEEVADSFGFEKYKMDKEGVFHYTHPTKKIDSMTKKEIESLAKNDLDKYYDDMDKAQKGKRK